MTYETGTATSIQDLFDKLSTFLTTTVPGSVWTDRALTTTASEGYAKTGAPDPIEVQFRWDSGTPANVGVFQSTGFVGVGTAPGNHTNDSGQGVISGTNATIATGRHVTLVNTSMPYWFFEGTGNSKHYLHAVVQIAAGPPKQLVQFGFGNLEKRGTWTGGAYAYGQKRATTVTPAGTDSSFLLDGLAASSAMDEFAASLHCEGLNNMGGSQRWALVWGDNTNLGTDRGGNNRVFVQGWYRGGLSSRFFLRPQSQQASGMLQMSGSEVCYRDQVPNPDRVQLIGEQPDTRAINVHNLTEGQELTVGSQTWVCFPAWRNGGTSSNETRDLGFAHLKVP